MQGGGDVMAIDPFRDAMRSAGLEPPDVIEPGKLYRFPGVGKRNGNTAGWCKLFADGLGGSFGDFAADFSQNWQAKREKPFTRSERQAFKRKTEQAKAQADAERTARHAEAARKAATIWNAAIPAPDDHPYLSRKSVKAHGARLHNDALVIPMREGGGLHSVQFIAPDGAKRFLSGGRVKGCYFSIGKPGAALCVTEGFATACSIHEATGHACACAFSAGNLRAVAEALRKKYPAARILICGDHDDAGVKGAQEAAEAVGGAVAIPPSGDWNDYDAQHGADRLRAEIDRINTEGRRTLDDVVSTFRRWLFLEDPAPLYAAAATLVANRAIGDPVWLLLVCAPSTGKTEILNATSGLVWVHSVAKVTEASLLSGTSKRERIKGATGGILRQVGEFGVLLCKDFTSVLSQNGDARAEAMAALREIYDGRWDRPVGTDGGQVLSWQGKCGLIGAVTPAIDQYGQVISALGDRFVLLRMPDADVDEFGRSALLHGEHERDMRRELATALAGLVEHADISGVNRPRSDDEQRRLIGLAAYTARARTAVVRDGYRQDVLFLPQVEGPGRLVKAYARLLGALEAIGCGTEIAWQVLTRIPQSVD